MNAFRDVFEHTIALAEKNASVGVNNFLKDGLLHCGDCKTPKQHKLTFAVYGVEKIVPCLCKCGIEKLAAEEEEQARQDEISKIKRLRSNAIQDKQIHNWTFANDDGHNPSMTDKVMRYYTKWQQMYDENIGILFWGNVGTGKTYSAACIANALIENKVPVLMTNFAKIINAMSGFSTEDKNGYLNSFNRYKLLIIDDLGAERQSEFAREIVYNVIDTRYKDGQPLIITTNMTLDEIKNPRNITCGRIYDRVLEMCVPIEFKGESRRIGVYRDKIAKARSIFED